MNVVMIPSVGGGIGHIARTAVLAGALQELQPGITIEYVLDTDRLRPFNVDAALATGFKVHLLPARTRESRNGIVEAALGRADIIVDDTSRYLIPLRKLVPRATWISIPLFPVGDELFMDWPFLQQIEGIIWAYPSVVDYPPELDLIDKPLLRSGPFLDLKDVPERSAARASLGLAADAEIIVYAPRGMPFGREFGERVLTSVFQAAAELRAQGRPVRLVFLAVRDRDELRAHGMPAELPDWVDVVGLIPQQQSFAYARAANIVIAEGTSTAHEAAALGTALIMVPGPIAETRMLGTRLHERDAAHVVWIEQVTPMLFSQTFRTILDRPVECNERLRRARQIVTGSGGVAAARFVLDLHAQRQKR